MIGFLFPGQGSQAVGMGESLYNTLPAASAILDEACDVLGYDLKQLLFEGPTDKLSDTRYAQPAIYTSSAMYLEKARESGLTCDYVAGHSLGEYNALYAAGVYSFADGLRLVERRGEAMSRMNGRGTMAAVLGIQKDDLETLVNDLPGVVLANVNTRNQIVVSGSKEQLVDLQARIAVREGAKFRWLRVSAAFHSPQMADAAQEMAPIITNATLQEPTCMVVPNITAVPTRDIKVIRKSLVAQITGQVLWSDSILAMKSAGVKTLYEVGYGDVLKKMNKAITFRPKCLGIEL